MTDYNGWTNWETWNVNLWVDNEEPMYRAKVRFLRSPGVRGITASTVKAFVLDLMPKGTPDMDKEDGGYAAVNWAEIAEHWADEAGELARD